MLATTSRLYKLLAWCGAYYLRSIADKLISIGGGTRSSGWEPSDWLISLMMGQFLVWDWKLLINFNCRPGCLKIMQGFELIILSQNNVANGHPSLLWNLRLGKHYRWSFWIIRFLRFGVIELSSLITTCSSSNWIWWWWILIVAMILQAEPPCYLIGLVMFKELLEHGKIILLKAVQYVFEGAKL